MRKRILSSAATLNETLFPPPGDWAPTKVFPNLSGIRQLGIDIESKDPDLHIKGPGFIRGNAAVVGVSLATSDASWYFPIGHLSGGNLDKESVVRFLSDVLADETRELIGANLQYELEGLWHLGITPRGKLLDVQIAEALLEEERDEGYDLETLSRAYLGEQKDEGLLRMAAEAYGIDLKKELWKLHSKYVGPYAKMDASLPLRIFALQRARLEREGLTNIFDLETRLLPILWEMRRQGIPIDLEQAAQLSLDLSKREEKLRNELYTISGNHIDVWSGKDLERLCTNLKIWFPRTEKGNPSFTGEFLEDSDHSVLQKIAEIRETNRLRQTFVDDWIFKNQVRGNIHPQWKQLKSDDGGARTGRMAAANPNPMQVPARGELAPLVRRVFRRPNGRPWAKLDYSQQEPRILTHYAYICKLPGATAVRDAYCNDKAMDIYQFLSETAGISRRESKDLTLGRCYGMGKKKLAAKLGIGLDAAASLLEKFDRAIPFVRAIAEDASRKADQRGWIKTLCGRKRHFNYWEPRNTLDLREQGRDVTPVSTIKQAEEKWPGMQYRRAYTHKALNALVQGSAADMSKMAIILGREQQGRIPFIAVHDELNGAVDDLADAERWRHLCETCVEMSVPIKADLHFGESWK